MSFEHHTQEEIFELASGLVDHVKINLHDIIENSPAIVERFIMLHDYGSHLFVEKIPQFQAPCALLAWASVNAMIGWYDVCMICLRNVLYMMKKVLNLHPRGRQLVEFETDTFGRLSAYVHADLSASEKDCVSKITRTYDIVITTLIQNYQRILRALAREDIGNLKLLAKKYELVHTSASLQ